MLQYPRWRTLSCVLVPVLLRQIERRKSLFLILSMLRAVLDVMTSFVATWTCNENTQLDSLIFEAPCPEVTWFFQKGLGSRLLRNALSRCGMHSFHWRFSLSLKLKKQAINLHSGSGWFFSVDSSELVLELCGKARHLLDILGTSSLSPKSCIAW